MLKCTFYVYSTRDGVLACCHIVPAVTLCHLLVTVLYHNSDNNNGFIYLFCFMDFVEQINVADRHEYTAGLFLDLLQAFNTIIHKPLLPKLQIYSIRGLAHD